MSEGGHDCQDAVNAILNAIDVSIRDEPLFEFHLTDFHRGMTTLPTWLRGAHFMALEQLLFKFRVVNFSESLVSLFLAFVLEIIYPSLLELFQSVGGVA